jgi:predicted nucleic acid-binding protein
VILLDTSIWIDLLNRKPRSRILEKDILEFCSCGPVLQEVLQGLRDDPSANVFRELFLTLPLLSNPLRADTFITASDIYRSGRRKGFAIRSSVDCLIAAIAIENQIPIWHRDRDFDVIARFTELRAVQRVL